LHRRQADKNEQSHGAGIKVPNKMAARREEQYELQVRFCARRGRSAGPALGLRRNARPRALSGTVLALIIGIGGVMLRDSRFPALRWLVVSFVEAIRNTPFLGQIYFVYFALPLAGIRLDPTTTAIIALGVNGDAYAIEIIRGGVQSINKGQIEAGLALA
jgi:His/Glu/Gln/Arg/opine family amino acid ABC transporter permease subunit